MTASAIFDIIAPQLATDALKDDYILLAQGVTSVCQYGSNYNKAVALRAAHDLTLVRTRGDTADAGTIGSKREGDLGIVYGKTTSVIGDDPYLSQTHYGMQLMRLSKETILRVAVTGGGLRNQCSS